jgi:hypothetical protein
MGRFRRLDRGSAKRPLSAHLPPCGPSRRRSLHPTDIGHSGLAAGTGLHAPHRPFPLPIRGSLSGGFLPFPICLARDAHTLKAVIYYRPLRSPCPRADAARVGIQRDVPVKIRWHLVMLGSDRLKRADTGPDTTIRMRSENRDFRQLHCLETVSPRRAGELRDRGLHEPVSAGPHWIRICGKHASRQKCCTQDQGLTNNRHMTSSPSSVSIGKSSGGNGALRLGNL